MNYFKISTCTSILFLCCGVIAGAQQRVMSLDNAIAIGIKNNYDILMAKNQEAVAANDYSYAFGAFLPSLNAQASKTWSTTNVQLHYAGSDTLTKKTGAGSANFNGSVNLDWTLFDGLRVFATKDKYKAIQQAGTLAVKTQVSNSIANIISAYYDIVQLVEQLKTISDQMAISQERVNIARNKFQSGLGSKIDMLQAQVDLNAQKAAYLAQQTLIDNSKATLNQMIALPAENNDYVVTDSIPLDTTLTYGEFKTQVFDNNFALLLAQKNIDIAKYSLQEIQRSRFPVITFNSSYTFNKQVNKQLTNKFSPLSNKSNGLSYGFTANIPIFNNFNINRQAKDAQLNIDYEKLNFENQKSQVDVALLNAYKDYAYYLKALKLEEENLGIAKENEMVALEAFKQGQTTTIEVKTAQQGLADAIYRLISAKYNAKLSETTLLELRGDLLK